MNIPRKHINTMSQATIKQSGFSLTELLVAIVLGLLLTGAVVQSYLSTRQSYRVTEGVSRIQENARFSLYFLSKDIRNAGYSGCIGSVRNKLNGDPSEFLSFLSPIVGWNYKGTDASSPTPIKLSKTISKPSADNWEKSTLAGTQEPLPSFLAGRVAKGSDVIKFKGLEELDLVIKTHNDNGAPIVTSDAHGIPNDSIMIVGDCSRVEIFQHLAQGNGSEVSLVAAEGGGNPAIPGNRKTSGSGEAKWARDYTPEDKFFGFFATYYYIGEGVSGLPSLFKFRSSSPANLITATEVDNNTQELVEGVETLQMLFGEDRNTDQNPNIYVSGNEVEDWDKIVSVRLGLLLTSPNSAADQDQQSNYRLLDSIDIEHSADDLNLRYAVNSTIKLRNRGLDEKLSFYICDAAEGPDDPDGNGISGCSNQPNGT